MQEHVKKSLMANWGDKADALDCFVPIKLIDPVLNWACYIFAMNPDYQDIVSCVIVHGTDCEIYTLSLSYVLSSYNHEGEGPKVDDEFRTVHLSKILKSF